MSAAVIDGGSELNEGQRESSKIFKVRYPAEVE